VNQQKDKLQVNLYETSSPILESALHCNRIAYNLSWTGFVSKTGSASETGSGNIFYGNLAVSPTKRITISGNGNFSIIPRISIRARLLADTDRADYSAPPGIDFSASNYMHYQSLTDSSTNQIIRSASVTMKPGTWVKFLSWISPIFGVNQTLNCAFDLPSPSASDLLFGGKVIHNSITKDAGANVFITNDITLRKRQPVHRGRFVNHLLFIQRP